MEITRVPPRIVDETVPCARTEPKMERETEGDVVERTPKLFRSLLHDVLDETPHASSRVD
jgi:hypothetical protein